MTLTEGDERFQRYDPAVSHDAPKPFNLIGAFPPFGSCKTTCTRLRTTDGSPCQRQAAEWPVGYVPFDDPVACWSHLSNAERAWSLEARQRYKEAWYTAKAEYERNRKP
ncbi:hypothetical protein ACFZAU_41095 [Streptomyces sp. NPDC008238]